MARITRKDYETLQQGLRELYAHHDLDTLPRAAVALTSRLVPNNLAAYNEVDPHRRRLNVVFEPADNEEHYLAQVPLWEKYMHQHPLVAHYLQHPADGPLKISDFLTNAQFRRMELYTDFYRQVGCRYQIVTSMPAPQPLTVAIAMNRWDKDFNERDRAVLSLVQPHLRQAYDNAALVTELSQELGRAYDVLDRIDRGVVVIDENGKVDRASPAAVRFSAEHFAGEEHAVLARRLPDTLMRWAQAQINAMRQDGDDAARPAPMILERPDGRLIIRAVADRQPHRYLLIMHRARLPDTAAPLEGLGLTKREAETLHLAVEGKTNQQIGQTMGISERTVHKHLENVFKKLHVTNRTAAVTRALEWLRL